MQGVNYGIPFLAFGKRQMMSKRFQITCQDGSVIVMNVTCVIPSCTTLKDVPYFFFFQCILIVCFNSLLLLFTR